MLDPDSSSLLEEGDELSLDMEAHDLVCPSDEFLVDEHRRKESRFPAGCRRKRLLEVGPVGQLVELVDRGVGSEAGYQCLDCVGHAAVALAEYHHRLVRRQPLDRIHYCGGTLVFVV